MSTLSGDRLKPKFAPIFYISETLGDARLGEALDLQGRSGAISGINSSSKFGFDANESGLIFK